MITIYMTWADKRHVTLRSDSFENGAHCLHYKTEKEATDEVYKTIDNYKASGYNVRQVAERDWEMSKNEH